MTRIRVDGSAPLGEQLRAFQARAKPALDAAVQVAARRIMDQARGCTCGDGWTYPARDEGCPLHGVAARRRARWRALPQVVRRAIRGRWPAAGL